MQTPIVIKNSQTICVGPCLLDFFDNQSELVNVSLKYDNKKGEAVLDYPLKLIDKRNEYNLRLYHKNTENGCPMRNYCNQQSELKQEIVQNNKKIGLAACGFIVDKNNKILITRRSKQMRQYPQAWVVPGGKVDMTDKSLEHALLREIKEEVGLDIKQIDIDQSQLKYLYKELNIQLTPFFLWESSYEKQQGDQFPAPQNQILIIYYLIQIPLEHNEIQLQIEPNEIDGYLWSEGKYLQRQYIQQIDKKLSNITSLKGFLVDQDMIYENSFQIKQVCPPYSTKGEGISAAVEKAIELFLELKLIQKF